jgi:hypothetical protein
MRTTYPAHLILIELICVIVFGDEYKFLSSSYPCVTVYWFSITAQH